MNFRVVARILGAILLTFSLSQLVLVPVALIYGEFSELVSVLESMSIGALLGAALFFAGRGRPDLLFRREALAIVGLSWILVAALGALPFHLGGMVNNYADAYFESMSGLTTTGSSVLTDVEGQARTMLFWRSFLHFVGGLGIVVFFVAILPILGVGGKTLIRQEITGPVPDSLTPRVKDTAVALTKIYIGFNVLEAVILRLCGMDTFDAINHAMATIATGGFSTRNTSVLYYTPLVEWVLIVFMYLASANFSLHLRFLQGERWCYFKDSEFRWFTAIVLAASVFFAAVLHLAGTPAVSHPGQFNARDGLFTTLTVMSTTGFGTVDFDQWPAACKVVIVALMFLGGMAGSTAGGMKIIRGIILFRSVIQQLGRETSPRLVRLVKIDGKALDPRTQTDTYAFFFAYMAVFVLGSLLVTLAAPDHSLVTCVTSVATCLNNVGPGLEAVGPTMNFSGLPSVAKWILSLCMLMGRLELYAILIILNPNFWLSR